MGHLLPDAPFLSFDEYVRAHDGGAGIEAARRWVPTGRSPSSRPRACAVAVVRVSRRVGSGSRSAPAAPRPGDRYVVANGAEGEPGTFKDRTLMRRATRTRCSRGCRSRRRRSARSHAFVGVKRSFASPDRGARRVRPRR